MQSVHRPLSQSYRADPSAVVAARRALAEFAARSGAGAAAVQAVRLASSEALTNAVQHAYPGAPGSGRVHVTAGADAGELRVRISDDGCGIEPQSERAGLGFGLVLMAELSDSVTIAPRPGGGTEVLMRFTLAGAPPAPQPRSGATARPVAAAAYSASIVLA